MLGSWEDPCDGRSKGVGRQRTDEGVATPDRKVPRQPMLVRGNSERSPTPSLRVRRRHVWEEIWTDPEFCASIAKKIFLSIHGGGEPAEGNDRIWFRGAFVLDNPR